MAGSPQFEKQGAEPGDKEDAGNPHLHVEAHPVFSHRPAPELPRSEQFLLPAAAAPAVLAHNLSGPAQTVSEPVPPFHDDRARDFGRGAVMSVGIGWLKVLFTFQRLKAPRTESLPLSGSFKPHLASIDDGSGGMLFT